MTGTIMREWLKELDRTEVPINWKANSKAWMTGTIMREWLKELDSKMQRQKRHILLFVDNACSHPKELHNTAHLYVYPLLFVDNACSHPKELHNTAHLYVYPLIRLYNKKF
ncbi:DDE superfamily endonuclease [Popillia japonica]|uniref:DDE superfamily endonuclease n=1 Tax=Popillia japonica TaxID=7064 RepID=A0AAW1IE13_POPJA